MLNSQETIAQLYVGLFNRAPDPAGSSFWVTKLDSGVLLNDIARDFSTSPEALAIFPSLAPDVSLDAPALITSVYMNLFGRAPEAAGLAHWVAVLENGTSASDTILSIIYGAQGDDALILANKVEIALCWTDKAASDPDIIFDAATVAASTASLDSITADSESVTRANEAKEAFFDQAPVDPLIDDDPVIPADPGIPTGPTNTAPIADDGTATGDEDTVITGQATASDLDGDTLTFAKASDPANGTVTVNPDGSYSYTPDADFSGEDSFTITASDATTNDSATITITVRPVNDAPVADDGTAAGDEDTVITGQATASDLDGDTLTFAKASDPANGTVTVNSDGSYSYTPDADFSGEDSFTITASDATTNDSATITITVRPVNDAPVADDGTATGDEDTIITGQATASDLDGDTLTFAKASDPSNGTVTVNPDGSYSYSPDANFVGEDSFTITASDATTNDTATITITVQPTNDAPVADDGTAAGDEDTVITGQATASDLDGDTLTFAKASDPANGTVTVNPDGSYSYTPDADFSGEDSFTITASDATTNDSATITITVQPTNDAPVADDGTATGDEDTVITGQATASDLDGDTLTFAKASDPANGTVTVNPDGSYSYTPDADFSGEDSFTVTAADATTNDTATITITVQPTNDAPVADDGTATGDEDTIITGQATASDLDGDTLTFAKASDPANGTVTVNPDGSYSYTPDADFSGEDSFTVTAADATTNDTATITITVQPTNDAPTGGITISGTPEATQTLTAETTNLTDADGLGPLNYQWQRDNNDIIGATGETYLLDNTDIGTSIKVIVSYTDGGGTAESVSHTLSGTIAQHFDASDLIVTTTADTVDSEDGFISLREAVANANAHEGIDEITFASGSSDAFENTALIRLAAGQITITDQVTISGAGNVVISGDTDDNDITIGASDITDIVGSSAEQLADNSRIFSINGNADETILSGLTLTGGHSSGAFAKGGAVFSSADVNIIDTTISGNSVSGSSSRGGGIAGTGLVTIIGSTISGNSVDGSIPRGGGVHGNGLVTLTDSTISGNRTSGNASDGAGVYAQGGFSVTGSIISENIGAGINASAGGIYGSGQMTITDSIISGNALTEFGSGGGGVYAASSNEVSVSGSIISGNKADDDNDNDVRGTVINIGGNIVGNSVTLEDTGIAQATAIQIFETTFDNNGVLAGVLADNGGSRETIALNQPIATSVAGLDVFIGTGAADIFSFANGSGDDYVWRFNVAADQIDLTPFGFADFAAVSAASTDDGNGNLVITLDADDSVTLVGIDISDLGVGNFSL